MTDEATIIPAEPGIEAYAIDIPHVRETTIPSQETIEIEPRLIVAWRILPGEPTLPIVFPPVPSYRASSTFFVIRMRDGRLHRSSGGGSFQDLDEAKREVVAIMEEKLAERKGQKGNRGQLAPEG